MEQTREPRYKWLAVPPDMHEEIVDIRKFHGLKYNYQVLKMLLAFYTSGWQDEKLLNEIIATIRGDKDGDTDSGKETE
jgi:hypothetical protein